jgi:hypothetical protein
VRVQVCEFYLLRAMDAREFRLRVMASELERTTSRAEQAEAHVKVLTCTFEEQRVSLETALQAANDAHREDVEAWRKRMVRCRGNAGRGPSTSVCVCAYVCIEVATQWCDVLHGGHAEVAV